MKELGRRLLFWSLFPLLIPQALWVRRSAPRFAPAGPPRQGLTSANTNGDSTIQLLAIGDSIIDGVGCATVKEALPGQFAQALAETSSRDVAWQAIGGSGTTAAQIRDQLIPRIPPRSEDHSYDLILISVGVNNVTGLSRSARWQTDLTELLNALRERAPQAWLILCGLPPLWGFPLLPQPLRWVLGQRAKTLDAFGAALAERSPRCQHIPTCFEPEPRMFAADGYHPNAESCAIWAQALATQVAPLLAIDGAMFGTVDTEHNGRVSQ